MKKRTVLRAMAEALMLWACLLQTHAWGGVEPTKFNVKYYGVKGDGATDDTEALQRAFDQAAKTGVGELFFPQGNYIISKPVVPRVSMRGPATFWGKDPDQDIFYSEYAHQISFTHLVFRGRRTALNLANPNVDTGFIQIIDCKFFDTSAAAVRVREGSNSTFTLIRRSQFIRCAQVLITHTDGTTMRDCWISGGHNQGSRAMIENRSGNMLLENILGVPNVTAVDQRWVDNYSLLTCRNFRFGGESGGFTPVYNFAGYSTQAGGAEGDYRGLVGLRRKQLQRPLRRLLRGSAQYDNRAQLQFDWRSAYQGG